jgi:hypothetical protein
MCRGLAEVDGDVLFCRHDCDALHGRVGQQLHPRRHAGKLLGIWRAHESLEVVAEVGDPVNKMNDPPAGHATQPVVSLDLRTPLGEVSLFTVIATIGAPPEVTAASLAIETFVPMDARSAARLGELAGKSRGE